MRYSNHRHVLGMTDGKGKERWGAGLFVQQQAVSTVAVRDNKAPGGLS